MQLQLVFGIGSICLLAVCVTFSSGLPAKDKSVQHSPSRKSQRQQIPNCDEPGHRFHSETERCYPLYQQGPCGRDMMIIEDERNGMATCICINRIGCHYWPFTYSPEANQCFPLYEKGYCNENEWLVSHPRHNNQNHHRNQQDSPMMTIQGMCKRRECPNDGATMLFQHKGICYKMDTQGFCPPGEKLYFPQGSAEPKCGNQAKRIKAGLCSSSPNNNNNPNGGQRPFQQQMEQLDDGLYAPNTNVRHGSRPHHNHNHNHNQNKEVQIPVPIQIIPHPGPIIVPQKFQNLPVSNTPSSLIVPGPAPALGPAPLPSSIPIQIQNSNSNPYPNPYPVPTSAINPIPIQQYSEIPAMTSSDIIDVPDQRVLSKSGTLPCPDGAKKGPDGRCGVVAFF